MNRSMYRDCKIRNNVSKRDSNIELLRIVAAIGVVISHIYGNVGDVVNKLDFLSFDGISVTIIESISSLAVNVFLIIFGYYNVESKKNNVLKALLLIVDVVFYRVLTYIFEIVLGISEFSIVYFLSRFLPINYYVILYIGVSCFSTYINRLVISLEKKDLKKLGILSFAVISVEPYLVDILELVTGYKCEGLSFIGLKGGQAGYTLINFMLLYFVGATIRVVNKNVLLKCKILVFGSCLIVVSYLEFVFRYKRNMFYGDSIALYYNSPLIIIFAVCLFLIFKDIKIHSEKINHLAKASFTSYLTHVFFLTIAFKILDTMKVEYWTPIVLLLSILCYLCSYIMYKCFNPIIESVKKIIILLVEKIYEEKKYASH